MQIRCRRCENAAVGNYDTELLCSDCMAAEMRHDRIALTQIAADRIDPTGRAA